MPRLKNAQEKMVQTLSKWAFDASFTFVLKVLANAMKNIKHSRDVLSTLTSHNESMRIIHIRVSTLPFLVYVTTNE